MREATRLTQAGKLSEATQLIQRAMAGSPPVSESATPTASDVLDGLVFEVDEAQPVAQAPLQAEASALFAKRVDSTTETFTETFTETLTETFTSGQFAREGQTHHYKLYSPAGVPVSGLADATSTEFLPLVVMLHGCTQNPDDFSVGTAMNVAARAQGFYVLYPSQQRASNSQGCWNWFERGHQQRGSGEPAWIAELTRHLLRTLPIDSGRIYIAGLSAGGAMAAVVAAAYPDLFAAVGVHSGLPVGAARNLAEALRAMKHGASQPRSASPPVPSIVFHGDQDRTVHARNAQGLINAAIAGAPCDVKTVAGTAMGRKYTRSVYARESQGEARGQVHSQAELWQLHGAGHAWAGGNPAGSYADAKGIDATAEMLRFFWCHPHQHAG